MEIFIKKRNFIRFYFSFIRLNYGNDLILKKKDLKIEGCIQ